MKRICMLLILCALLVSALSCYAAAASFTASVGVVKDTAAVGDTVEFVVTAEGTDVVALQFELAIPKGLRYVPDSAEIPKGLRKSLNIAGSVDWTEESLMFTFYNDEGIVIPKGTELMRFSCTVMTEGTFRVTLQECLPFDGNFAEFTPSIQDGVLKVESESASQPNPGTAPDHNPDASVQNPDAPVQKPDESVTEIPTVQGSDAVVDSVTEVTGNLTQDPPEPERLTEPATEIGSAEIATEPKPEQVTADATTPTEKDDAPQAPEKDGDQKKSIFQMPVFWIVAAVVLVLGAGSFAVLKKKK